MGSRRKNIEIWNQSYVSGILVLWDEEHLWQGNSLGPDHRWRRRRLTSKRRWSSWLDTRRENIVNKCCHWHKCQPHTHLWGTLSDVLLRAGVNVNASQAVNNALLSETASWCLDALPRFKWDEDNSLSEARASASFLYSNRYGSLRRLYSSNTTTKQNLSPIVFLRVPISRTSVHAFLTSIIQKLQIG